MICLYLQIGEKIPRRYILIQLNTLKKTMGPKESMSNNHKCKKTVFSFFFPHISSCHHFKLSNHTERLRPCYSMPEGSSLRMNLEMDENSACSSEV